MYVDKGYLVVHYPWILIALGIGLLLYAGLLTFVFGPRRWQCILYILRGCPEGMAGRDIGKLCGLSAPYVTLARMEDLGLISRTVEDDRHFAKIHVFHLTEKGQSLFRTWTKKPFLRH